MSLFNETKTVTTTTLQSHTDSKFMLENAHTTNRRGWVALRQHNFAEDPTLVLVVQMEERIGLPWQFNLTPKEAIALGNDLIEGATAYLTELKQRGK